MASVMNGEVGAYNSGNALDEYKLSGGMHSVHELGENIYGNENNQSIDHSIGGNMIKMHEQYGGRKGKGTRMGKRRGKTNGKTGGKTSGNKRRSSKRRSSKRKSVGGAKKSIKRRRSVSKNCNTPKK
jgi:hypothetical protein